MAELIPQFESTDKSGETKQYTGTVGLTAILVPASPGAVITELLVRCGTDNTPNSERLQWSLDNITYHSLAPGEFVGWSLKGSVTQVYLKGTSAAVDYEVLINRESV